MRFGQPKVLLRQAGQQIAPAISPDGRWMAYTSDESGRSEVYVTPFAPQGPAPGGKWQVSNDGGAVPRWSPIGRELFYRGPDRRVMAVAYTSKSDSFAAEKPRVWAEKRLANVFNPSFDVAPDGKHIVGLFDAEEGKPDTMLRVLLHVDDELRRRAALGSAK
jgi:serine/threonine-protein kinase